MVKKEDGDADGGEDNGHPADPQRLARALLGAEESPAVKAGGRAEPVKVCPRSSRHCNQLEVQFAIGLFSTLTA